LLLRVLENLEMVAIHVLESHFENDFRIQNG